MKTIPYCFSRSLCFQLERNLGGPWYGNTIWFVTLWPLYALFGFMILCGIGMFGDGHNNGEVGGGINSILYPNGMQAKWELDQSTLQITREQTAADELFKKHALENGGQGY